MATGRAVRFRTADETKRVLTRSSPLAAKFLVRNTADYAGAFLENDDHWEGWSKLPEAVRDG